MFDKFLNENFGTLTNLTLTLCVVMYGAATWLRNRSITGYLKMTYQWWWLSWLAWFVAWLMLLLKAVFIPKSDPVTVNCQQFLINGQKILVNGQQVFINCQQILNNKHLVLDIPTLFMDNANSVCMTVVYFALTRGDSFDQKESNITAIRLAGSIVIGCCIIYLTSIALGVGFAYNVHHAWSLALGIIAPMLVGWGCYLRYNTLLPAKLVKRKGFNIAGE